jgi:hypothetical protein
MPGDGSAPLVNESDMNPQLVDAGADQVPDFLLALAAKEKGSSSSANPRCVGWMNCRSGLLGTGTHRGLGPLA